MPLTQNDRATWLDTLWDVIWALEDCEPGRDMDDAKTAMAWLTESLDLDAGQTGADV